MDLPASIPRYALLYASGSDAMTIDEHRNVCLCFGKVLVFNPKGQKIGEIELQEIPH